MNNLKTRKGEFSIPSGMITKARPELLNLMGNFLIVRCEHEFMVDSFRYHAYSPLFDEVPDGFANPVYEIKENRGEDGTYAYSVVRRSNATVHRATEKKQ